MAGTFPLGAGLGHRGRCGRRFWFEERGLERIVSITQVGNDASERIMTKLETHPVRETVNPTCGRRVRVFELSSDQYVTTTH